MQFYLIASIVPSIQATYLLIFLLSLFDILLTSTSFLYILHVKLLHVHLLSCLHGCKHSCKLLGCLFAFLVACILATCFLACILAFLGILILAMCLFVFLLLACLYYSYLLTCFCAYLVPFVSRWLWKQFCLLSFVGQQVAMEVVLQQVRMVFCSQCEQNFYNILCTNKTVSLHLGCRLQQLVHFILPYLIVILLNNTRQLIKLLQSVVHSPQFTVHIVLLLNYMSLCHNFG